MPIPFFTNFPTVTYNGKPCKNITTRTKILENVEQNGTLFLDYVLTIDDNRPYVLASDYYGDPYYDWLIYYSNKTIDPYYEWYLNDTDFSDLLIKKYQTIERADLIINKFVNSENTSILISKSSVFTVLGVDNVSNNFVVGETITQIQSGISKTGTVVSYGNTYLTVSDFDYVFNVDFPLSSDLSLNTDVVVANVTYRLANTDVQPSITTDDNITVSGIVPQPITQYEFEFNQNEERKNIRLLNKDLAPQAVQDLERLLS